MTMMHDQSTISSDEQTRMLHHKRKADKGDIIPSDLTEGKPLKKSKHTRASKAKWTPEEDDILSRAVLISGEGNWKKIAQALHDRSHLQCLHRWQKVLNPALVKGPWKEEEDSKLSELVEKYGPKDWSTIAGHIPGRIGKQCRERWFNHLSPDVRKTNWTPEEDKLIIDAHSKVGNKWTIISKMLDGRPANAIKNHWNSTLLKRIQDSNGEPTPRRDRNRTKKPAPQRATEFDFRTQMLQQQFDESSDCSPQQYSYSPVSSPDSYHQEAQLVNNVRYHVPDAPHVYFANPYDIQQQQHQHHHQQQQQHHQQQQQQHNITAVPAAGTLWDNWPAPNIIHLTHPPASLPTVNHGLNFNHLPNVHTPPTNNNTANTHFAAPLASNFTFNPTHNPVLNAMNGVYDTDSYSSLSLSESSSPEDSFVDVYSGAHQVPALPTELQYCFDPQQGTETAHYDGGHGTAMPMMDSSCMLSGGHGMNISNLGLLNLESISAFPLEI